MGPGAHDLRAITSGGTGAGGSGPAGAVPLSPSALRAVAAAATARGGLVRHAGGRAGGRPLMIFADGTKPAGCPPPAARTDPGAGRRGDRRSRVCAAGCGSGGFNGIYSIPLPGGADLGPHPYQVTAEFSNVLDLVPQSAVKVNDVAVGRVTRIYLPPHSWTARVTMLINGERAPARQRDRPAAAVQPARRAVRRAVRAAGRPPRGRLANGAVIPLVPHHPQRRPSRRCSARCRCCSTAAGSTSCTRSPPS